MRVFGSIQRLITTLGNIAAAAMRDLLDTFTSALSVVSWRGAIRFSICGLIVLGLRWGFDQVSDRPRLFPKKVFLSRSTWQDLGIIVVTAFLLAIPAMLWKSVDAAALGFVESISSVVNGKLAGTIKSPFAGQTGHASTVRLIRIVVVVLSADLASYCYHNLMHRIPWLWEFHKVHHSATVLTPFTSQRVHVMELLVRWMFITLVLGLTTGVTTFLFGEDAADVARGLAVYAYLFAYVLLLNHSHIWWSWGKGEYFLNSPAMHAIHHSRDPKHFNKNLGNLLSIWDVMFGTFYKSTRRPERLELGVDDGFDWASASQLQLLVHPFGAILGRRGEPTTDPELQRPIPRS